MNLSRFPLLKECCVVPCRGEEVIEQSFLSVIFFVAPIIFNIHVTLLIVCLIIYVLLCIVFPFDGLFFIFHIKNFLKTLS